MGLTQQGSPLQGLLPRGARFFLEAFWVRAFVLVVAAMLIALQWTNTRSTLRVIVAFVFLLFCPGISLVPLLRIAARWIQTVLVIPTSLAVDTAVTEVQLYGRLWSPRGSIIVLTIICIAGMTATRVLYGSSPPKTPSNDG